LLSLLKFRDELPTIGFCFDKRMCERVALLLAGAKRMDFSNTATKQQIHKRLEGGLAHLDQRDKQLAQVKNSCDLLVRGIGVHHGGMSLPQSLPQGAGIQLFGMIKHVVLEFGRLLI
jgi:antiviral helicase SKI2